MHARDDDEDDGEEALKIERAAGWAWNLYNISLGRAIAPPQRRSSRGELGIMYVRLPLPCGRGRPPPWPPPEGIYLASGHRA